jgi:hypothetical protein
MAENQNVLLQLEQLLSWKKSKKFYAEKLGITEQEVSDLLKEIRGKEISSAPETYEEFVEALEEHYTKVNNDKGTIESTLQIDFEPKSDLELAKLHKINLDKYKISNYWTKQKSNGKFTSSVFATLIVKNSIEDIKLDILESIKSFKPSSNIIKNQFEDKPKVCLVFPKQDAHYDKFDINGHNNIEDRFTKDQKSVWKMLTKTCATNTIEETIYIIGSDQFNSEWTTLTTKGTPQQNICSYQESFKLISNHEIEIINTLLHYSKKVKITYVPGNHDEFIGWNLINLLETYYRTDDSISFDTSSLNTKYHRFGNSAIMLNHGDAIKPAALAQKFPIGFKKEWSVCDNYYIFTGDKHTELSLDIQGIKFYRVPQLSSATSKWDDKNGYIDSKAEMTAFVITEKNGMSDIYKEIL